MNDGEVSRYKSRYPFPVHICLGWKIITFCFISYQLLTLVDGSSDLLEESSTERVRLRKVDICHLIERLGLAMRLCADTGVKE